MSLIIILLSILLSSCSFQSDVEVTCHIASEHRYEQATGKAMWHKLIYFDGKDVRVENIEAGVRRIRVKVKSSGLRVFVLIPLDKLSPLGGFFEDGNDKTVELYSEYGSIAMLLVEAAKYRPEVVSSLSIKGLISSGYDLDTIDQSHFLSSLYDGFLDKNGVRNAPYFTIELDTIPDGYWICDTGKAQSFYQDGSDKIRFKLFAGIYYFWNREKGLLLNLTISEDGRYYTSMDRLADLY